VAENLLKHIKQFLHKIENIPIMLDWEGIPKEEWPKIHEAWPHQRL